MCIANYNKVIVTVQSIECSTQPNYCFSTINPVFYTGVFSRTSVVFEKEKKCEYFCLVPYTYTFLFSERVSIVLFMEFPNICDLSLVFVLVQCILGFAPKTQCRISGLDEFCCTSNCKQPKL